MLAILRFRQVAEQDDELRSELRATLDLLGRQPGFLRGQVARAPDDPTLWLLATQWAGVGAYRRALSSYDVKVNAVPVLSRAVDEPGAFEVLDAYEGAAAPTT